MGNFRIIAAVACVILNGCATAPKVQLELISQAKLSATTIDRVPITGELQDELKVAITSESPVFEFPTGRSALFGFSLPARDDSYELELRSYLTGGHYDREIGRSIGHFFAPLVVFLDGQRRALMTLEPEVLTFEQYGFARLHTLVGRIRVPAGARFGILHTSYSKVGGDFQARAKSGGVTYMTGGIFVSIPGGEFPVVGQYGPYADVLIAIAKPGTAK